MRVYIDPGWGNDGAISINGFLRLFGQMTKGGDDAIFNANVLNGRFCVLAVVDGAALDEGIERHTESP